MFGIRQITPTVKILLIINIAIFCLQMIAVSFFNMHLIGLLGLFYFKSSFFQPFQLFSYMFAHSTSDLWHIFGNMLGLVIFGPALEQLWGQKRFLFLYLFAGIGAAVINQGINALDMYLMFDTFDIMSIPYTVRQSIDIPMVGASGAVFGVMLAYAMYFPNQEFVLLFPPIPVKAKYLVLFYTAYEIFAVIMPMAGDNVAHFAHLGGMLFAFILVKKWKRR